MDILKTIIAAAVAGAVILGGGVAFGLFKPAVALGSLAGPDIPSPYLKWGGVAEYRGNSTTLVAATTTPFAIQSPAATSTLQLGSGCSFSVGSTSAKSVIFAKASTAFATTTLLFGAPLAAGAQGTAIATTTTDNFVFGPNQWLVMSMVGGAGVDSPTASCSASFLVP